MSEGFTGVTLFAMAMDECDDEFNDLELEPFCESVSENRDRSNKAMLFFTQR